MEEMTRLETLERKIYLKKQCIEMVKANCNQTVERFKGEINKFELEKSEIEKVDITKGI